MLKVANDQGTHTSKGMTFVQDRLNNAGLGCLWSQEQFNPNSTELARYPETLITKTGGLLLTKQANDIPTNDLKLI